jgi:hypothetical protein
MTQEAEATTADILVSFQKRPGLDSDDIINAGNATLYMDGGNRAIRPSRRGIYTFNITPGRYVRFRLFDTDYVLKYQDNLELEDTNLAPLRVRFSPDSHKFLSAWQTLGSITGQETAGSLFTDANLGAVQRRLQLLGYYPGLVDQQRGAVTAHAILAFQADKDLLDDCIIGTNTKRKLLDVADERNKTGRAPHETFIVRRTMVRFSRAPSRTDPEATFGWPRSVAPEPDNRGYKKVRTMGEREYGPAISILRDRTFRVKVTRLNISNTATLVAKSSDEEVVRVVTEALPNTANMILEMESKRRVDGVEKAVISICWRHDSEDIEIGSITVFVVSKITRRIQPYFVSIQGSGPGAANITPAGTPAGSSSAADTAAMAGYRRDIDQVIGITKSLWRQYGIDFIFLAARDVQLTQPNAGVLTEAGFAELIQPTDPSRTACSDTVINVFFVHDIDGGSIGLCYDTRNAWPYVGIILEKNAAGILAAGNDLAHELGHFLTLSGIRLRPPRGHADDYPSDDYKNDLWTVGKLMYSYNPHLVDFNTGYGNRRRGFLVTLRKIDGDPLDDECRRLREHAVKRNFYRER